MGSLNETKMNRRQILKLRDDGCGFLEQGQFDEALKCGLRLEKLHSSGIEIAALALQKQNKPEKAVAVLKRGLRWADQVWLLWHLLGHCYSDMGRFREAEQAYLEALQRPHCNPHWVNLNRSIAFLRAGRINKAKSALRSVRLRELYRAAECQRIRLDLRAGKTREAVKRSLRLSARPRGRTEHYSREQEADMLLDCALGLRHDSNHLPKALSLARKAYGLWPSDRAFAAIREGIGKKSKTKRAYMLLIQGTWLAPFGRQRLAPGFLRKVQVVADDERAAFEYAKPFFPMRVRKSLSIHEASAFHASKGTYQGVYYLSPFIFYPRRKR